MKKRYKAAITVLLLILTASVLLFIRSDDHSHERMQTLWGLETDGWTEKYCSEHTDFFYGNELVFVSYALNAPIANTPMTRVGRETVSFENDAKRIEGVLEVPAAEQIDFTQEYFVQRLEREYGSFLLLFYFPAQQQCYVLETCNKSAR